MRNASLGWALYMVLLLPAAGSAQVFQLPTPPPQVTAAGAAWQLRGEPVFYAGEVYFPAGASVFFDGNVMQRTGTYQRVPLYVDATLEPYSVVYVPIGGNRMRPYERRRQGELAGTEGSRTPSFPIAPGDDQSLETESAGIVTSPVSGFEAALTPEAERPVETVGTIAASRSASALLRLPGRVESVPRPTANRGVWIAYDGTRWYSSGPAVSYAADRFARIGDYHGFPVYRDKTSTAANIYVPAVAGGPLAPYTRR